MKAYTMRHNAARAARAELGRAAAEGRDFHTFTTGPDDCIAWHWREGPEKPADGQVASGASEPRAEQEAAQAGRKTGKATKGDVVLDLLMREGGATNGEIMAATGWLTHTVRGFFAGKQMARTGYRAERFQREGGASAYRAVAR